MRLLSPRLTSGRMRMHLLALTLVVVVCTLRSLWCNDVVLVPVVAASTVFVHTGGVLVDSPLSLQGTDVGSTFAQLLARLEATISAQAIINDQLTTEIASLRANLTATTARLAAVESLAGTSTIVDTVKTVVNTVGEIGTLTGSSDIVAAVLGLKSAVTSVNESVVVVQLDVTTINGEVDALQTLTTSQGVAIAGNTLAIEALEASNQTAFERHHDRAADDHHGGTGSRDRDRCSAHHRQRGGDCSTQGEQPDRIHANRVDSGAGRHR